MRYPTRFATGLFASVLLPFTAAQTTNAVAHKRKPSTVSAAQARLEQIKKDCNVAQLKQIGDSASLTKALNCVAAEQQADIEKASAKNQNNLASKQKEDAIKAMQLSVPDQLAVRLSARSIRSLGLEDFPQLAMSGNPNTQVPVGAGSNPSTPPPVAPAPTNPTPDTMRAAAAAGDQVQESRYITPSACDWQVGPNGPSSATGQEAQNRSDHPGTIAVYTSLLAPKEASDMFGHRLGRHYIVYQVSVSNLSPTAQYIMHDVTLDLRPVLQKLGMMPLPGFGLGGQPLPAGQTIPGAAFRASSRDLTLLRGVPEKGQDLDPRNLTVHVLSGIGSVAAGVSGLTPFSDVMGSAVAVFAGPFIQAITGIAPDHTATQLNRLSDSAFASNTLVDKLHTKVFAVFVPEAPLFDRKEQSQYWKTPSKTLLQLPLDRINVCVDGSLVAPVDTAASPVIQQTDAIVKKGQMMSFAAVPAGTTIHYTINDLATPDQFTAYSAPFSIGSANGTVTVRAYSTSSSQGQSPVVQRSYTVADQAATPTIAPPAGAVALNSPVTLTSSSVGAQIFFTLDGSTPSATNGTLYSGTNQPTITTTNTIVKAIAIAPALAASDVASATYTLP